MSRSEWRLQYKSLLLLQFEYYHKNDHTIVGDTGCRVCLLVNPRRVCAARVIVLGSVCLSVCLSVLLSHISPMEHLFVLKTLSRTQQARKVKQFVGICLKRLRSRVMPRKISPLDTQQSARGYPTIVNNIQLCPKRCLLMPLARVGVRTESITRYSYNERHGQFPRTRIGIVLDTRYAFAPRVLHFSAFHWIISH